MEWKVKKPCKNCPLMDEGKAMHLDNGRVDEIKESLLSGDNFVCHETIYSQGKNDKRLMCAGAYIFLKNLGKPNQIMQLAERMGYD